MQGQWYADVSGQVRLKLNQLFISLILGLMLQISLLRKNNNLKL
jgi:hypothetical protein